MSLKEMNEKIEKNVVEGYKKIEEGVVGGFQKIADNFVEKHLAKEGETVAEAKERIAKEQAEREAKVNALNTQFDLEASRKAQEEMIQKSIEASKNAGKR